MDSVTNKKVMFSIGALLSLLLLIPTTQAAWQPDPAFGLGEAGKFAVLSLGKPSADTDGQSKLDLSTVTIYGDVGVGPYGTLDFQGPATINGNLYIDPTLEAQDILTDEGTVTGIRYDNINGDEPAKDLSVAVDHAELAAKNIAALPPTQTYPRLTTSLNIYGTEPMNVISIEGIDYKKSSKDVPLVLTLIGEADTLFVLNVSGKFVLGPNSSIRGSDEVDPSNVLINIKEGNTPVQFAANSFVGGTLLSPNRKMGPLQGASGPIIGALVQEISLVGGAVLNQFPLPVAVILADPTVMVGDTVQLDGSASSAPSGGDLEYYWSLEPPYDSTTTLGYMAVDKPYFIADVAGIYTVHLEVFDGVNFSEADTTTIIADAPGLPVDLTLTITDAPTTAIQKVAMTYTLDIANNSVNAASGVVLEVLLNGDVRGTPTGTFGDAGECSYTTESGITCFIDDMYAYESVSVLIELTPKRAGIFSIDANVDSLAQDENLTDNSAYAETVVQK